MAPREDEGRQPVDRAPPDGGGRRRGVRSTAAPRSARVMEDGSDFGCAPGRRPRDRYGASHRVTNRRRREEDEAVHAVGTALGGERGEVAAEARAEEHARSLGPATRRRSRASRDRQVREVGREIRNLERDAQLGEASAEELRLRATGRRRSREIDGRAGPLRSLADGSSGGNCVRRRSPSSSFRYRRVPGEVDREARVDRRVGSLPLPLALFSTIASSSELGSMSSSAHTSGGSLFPTQKLATAIRRSRCP